MFRAVIYLLMLFVVACSGGAGVTPLGDAGPLASWPPSPSQTRIVLLRTFSKPAELGIRSSFARKLWGAVAGSPNQNLVRPYAIAVDGKLLAVSDPGMNSIHVYDLERKKYGRISAFGNTQLQTPVGVAIAGERIFVADSLLGSVFVFDLGGKPLKEINELQRPTGLAFDKESGLLFVADTLAHEIAVFDLSGRRVRSFGDRGTEAGQLNYPSHLHLAGARLWVNDSMNFRVQAFSLSGEYLTMLGKHGDGSGYLSQPKGVGVDSDGHVYVAGATIDRVQIFSQDGQFLLSFGQTGQGTGEFTMPAGVAVEGDLIYVADSYNSRVQIFKYLGDD